MIEDPEKEPGDSDGCMDCDEDIEWLGYDDHPW